MCTLIFLYQFIDGFPIMALHNRYARVGSFEEPPRVSAGRFRVHHPVDSSSRGTWIDFKRLTSSRLPQISIPVVWLGPIGVRGAVQVCLGS